MDYSEEIKGLISQLGDEDEDVATKAEERLIEIGLPAVDSLIEATENTDPQVRFRAVWALGKIRDPRAYSIILKLTEDPDEAVSYDAVMSLGELGDARAIELLIGLVKRASEDDVLSGAAGSSLSKLGKLAVSPLVDILHTGSKDARSIAAYSLWSIDDESIIDHLAKLLDDPEDDLRIAGIESLAQMGEEYTAKYGNRCLGLIETRLSDPDDRVRDHAEYWAGSLRRKLESIEA